MSNYAALAEVLLAAKAWENMHIDAGLVPDAQLEYAIGEVSKMLEAWDDEQTSSGTS